MNTLQLLILAISRPQKDLTFLVFNLNHLLLLGRKILFHLLDT